MSHSVGVIRCEHRIVHFVENKLIFFCCPDLSLKKTPTKKFILEQIAPKHENFLKVVVFLSKFLLSKNKNKYFKLII